MLTKGSGNSIATRFNALTETDSIWERAKNYQKQQRDINIPANISVVGAIDVVFKRHSDTQLIIAGENDEAIDSVKTYIKGDTLVIERKGGNINFSSSNDSINISGGFFGSINGQSSGKAVVAIAAPVAPNVTIQGSSDVSLLDVDQANISVCINGSGDVEANGRVKNLIVSVNGSGDVDFSEVRADSAVLSVAGSGDITAHVESSVVANVAGSGGIKIKGNPSSRSTNSVGSGSIKFR